MGITPVEYVCFGSYEIDDDLPNWLIPVMQKTEQLQQDANERLEQEDVKLLIRDVLNEINCIRRDTGID